MKQIVYGLSILLLLWGCSQSDEIDYSALNVDFVRNKVDVGENSGILEIPVALSGCKNDLPLTVSVQFTSTDHSAVAGVDYELMDKQLVFNTSGTSMIRVRMIDNKEITDIPKDFTVHLKVETAGVQTNLPDVQVYIISEDVEGFVLTGNYTLTAQEFANGTNLTTEIGGVKIVQDAVMPERYYMQNLILVNGDRVLPLTRKDELYFTMDERGDLWMPVEQNIGDYGKGEGFTATLASDAEISLNPIKIEISGNKLIFNAGGWGGITIDAADKLHVYYALKNIVLEKINNQ